MTSMRTTQGPWQTAKAARPMVELCAGSESGSESNSRFEQLAAAKYHLPIDPALPDH